MTDDYNKLYIELLPAGHFFVIMNKLPRRMPKDRKPNKPQSEFVAKLETQWPQGNFLCVGLDSEYDKLPESVRSGHTVDEAMFAFNKAIIDATQGLVVSYKPNAAFYEAQGNDGLNALRKTIAYIHETQSDIPVILDAKRGDIGNTNNGYIGSAFDDLQADAITVHPYLGKEALQPFLDRKDKGIIVLTRTSNPGAGEFQDLPIDLAHLPDEYRDRFGDLEGLREITGEDIVPLYQVIAYAASRNWNANGNIGLVAGATYPEELKQIRTIAGDIPILIPGTGAQGGDVEKTVKAGMDSRGQGMIINASRSIIFAENPGNAASELSEQINLARAT